MLYLLPSTSAKITSADLAACFHQPEVPATYRQAQAYEYLLDAIPLSGDGSDQHWPVWSKISDALVRALARLERHVLLYRADAQLKRFDEMAKTDPDPARVETARKRFDRDMKGFEDVIERRQAERLMLSPANAAFAARAQLRALRSGFAGLQQKGLLTVAQVVSFAQLLRAAPALAAADPTGDTPDNAFEFARRVLPGEAEVFALIEASGTTFGRATRPKFRDAAERRGYMRDYMKAYRRRKKQGKPVDDTGTPAIDPLS